jgi:hypothetical protein
MRRQGGIATIGSAADSIPDQPAAYPAQGVRRTSGESLPTMKHRRHDAHFALRAEMSLLTTGPCDCQPGLPLVRMEAAV